MNWTLAINLNREALLRFVAALFELVGLTPGGAVERLPRCVRRAVLLVLQPAESAARRLVIAEAREMSVPTAVPRPALAALVIPRGAGGRVPAFQLYDPKKRFDEIMPCGPRYATGAGPRIFFFDGSDLPIEPIADKAGPSEPIDAARLCRRLLALKAALDDLPKQAKRLMRMQARRALAPPGPRRAPPLRPGFPPGHRARQVHPVDEILCECDRLARRALEPPRHNDQIRIQGTA